MKVKHEGHIVLHKENAQIFNHPLSPKDKTIWSFSLFPLHEGLNSFWAHVLCSGGESWELPRTHGICLPSFGCRQGYAPNKDADHRHEVWWGAVPSLGASHLLSQLWEAPRAKYGNQSRLQVRHQHIHGIGLVICLFSWCARLSCISSASWPAAKPPFLGKMLLHVPTCWSCPPKHGNSCWLAMPQLQPVRGYASRSMPSWLRPIRADMAPFLLGSPAYL